MHFDLVVWLQIWESQAGELERQMQTFKTDHEHDIRFFDVPKGSPISSYQLTTT